MYRPAADILKKVPYYFPLDKWSGPEIDTAKFLLLKLSAARTGKANDAYNAPDGEGRPLAGLLQYRSKNSRLKPVFGLS